MGEHPSGESEKKNTQKQNKIKIESHIRTHNKEGKSIKDQHN